MRRGRARAICEHLTQWGLSGTVERHGRTFVILVPVPDGRVAVWGETRDGRLRALVFQDDHLVLVPPPTDRARTPTQAAARIAAARYEPLSILSATARRPSRCR